MLILLVLALRGCLNARNERAIKDYVGQSSELIDQSKMEGNQLFALLGGSGDQDDAVDAANVVNGLRSESATLVDRAKDLDAPDEVSTAQDEPASTRSSCAATPSPRSPTRFRARSPTKSAARAPVTSPR